MFQQVLTSPYDWLDGEYNTVSPSGAKTNQHVGRGSFQGQYTISPSSSANPVDDSAIQAELAAQISAGHLPRPTPDAAGNNNTYYAVFFPHGVSITEGGWRSCTAGGFAAYHGTIANAAGHEIYYGVQPDFQAGSGCESGTGPGTTFDNEQSVASHELVETITDPEVGLATVVGAPLAWYDATNNEIGDICNAQEGTVPGSDGFTYTVQKEFSNVANDCIVTRAATADFAMAINPSSLSLAPGTSGTSTITTSVATGAAEVVSLSAGGTPQGATVTLSPTSVTAGSSSTVSVNTGTAPTGTFTVTIVGTSPSATHSTTLAVTVASPPAITSVGAATFIVGSPGSFVVTASGTPPLTLAESGALPSGVSFVDNGNGTATMSGSAELGTVGAYPITIAAQSSSGGATQSFSLSIGSASW